MVGSLIEMTQPSQNYAPDEISLRDLYLIVRRGLPLILIVSLVAGVAAYLFVSLQRPSYEAESTVLITPTPVVVEGSEIERTLVLDLTTNTITWETYQTIAFSRSVLEETLTRLQGDTTVSRLRGAGTLEKIVGPNRAGEVAAMTIAHRFEHADPETAAQVVDAWAAVTAETVGASLLSSLAAVQQATEEQLEALENRIAETEQRWAEFQSRDETNLLQARLAGIAERVPNVEARLEEVERDLAAATGARQVLAELETPGSAASNDSESALALLGAHGLPADTVAQLTALVRQNGDQDLVQLVRQVELQRLTADLAGLDAQRETLREQLTELQEQASNLRTRHAEMIVERERLQQQLEARRAARTELAALEPVLAYMNQLAPTNARILNPAAVPTEPTGPSKLLVAALATLAAGMLALLFVFIRAAVAEPAGPRAQGQPVNSAGA